MLEILFALGTTHEDWGNENKRMKYMRTRENI